MSTTTSNETETNTEVGEESREEATSAAQTAEQQPDGATVEETPAEPTDDAQDGEQTESQDGEQGDEQETGKANREAAKYRRQLRDVETERDTLAERVTTLERASVEAIASRHVERPAALWALGYKASDLVAEDGSIDSLRVREVCDEAKATFGLARSAQGNYVPNEGKKPSNKYLPDGFAGSFGPKD